MYRINRQFSILGLILMGLITLSGCATKKFVRSEVGMVQRTLEANIGENTKAIGETNEKVDAVDRRAMANAAAADQKAANAAQAASVADGKAVTANRAADTANQSAQQANNRINTVETRIAALDVYTAGEPQAMVFKVNSFSLTDDARQKLDSIADGVATKQSGYLIEIQGFTDATGSDNYNIGLSQRRAETALRYLVSKGIPLFRTTIVGLGEERPVAGNESREGREQNRRVEVRVLQSTGVHATTN